MYFFILFVGHPFLSYNNHMLMIFNLRALSYLEGTTTNDSRDEISEFFISGAQQIMNCLERRSLLQPCVYFKNQENMLFFITLPFLFISSKVRYRQRGMEVSF